jgi:hypothetical protein
VPYGRLMAWLKAMPLRNYEYFSGHPSLLRIRAVERWILCGFAGHFIFAAFWGLKAPGISDERTSPLRAGLSSGKERQYGRVRALLLIVSLLLPLAQQVLGPSQTFESALPACCRAHGKHQCAAASEQKGSDSSSRQIVQVGEKCPCLPAFPSSVTNQPAWNISPHNNSFPIAMDGEALDGITVHRTASPERFHPKRGPPHSSIFA